MPDLVLTITISDLKVPQAKAAFLARHPKPTDTEHPDYGLTDKEWFEAWISAKVNRELQLGKRDLDTPAADKTDYFA
jgi:hypothetical protein